MNAGARAAFHNQEVSFSLCMAAVAVLARDNPAYSSKLPEAFALLLAFNLVYCVILRKRGDAWVVPMLSMAANTVLVTLVLRLSGGSASPFWPMYLIPIFTACLYLDRRHVAFASVSSSAFAASLYLLDSGDDGPLQWALVELVIKVAVLSVSAAVVAQYSFRERRARADLGAARRDLEKLEARLDDEDRGRKKKGDEVKRFVSGLVYDMDGRLSLLTGRAELLRRGLPAGSPAHEDAAALVETARALNRLSADLLRRLKKETDRPDPRGA